MDDIMGKIQDVLSDEESMNQIKQLANMLGMDKNSESSENSSHEDTQSSQTENNDFLADFDISKIMMIKDAMQKVNKHDSDVNFLLALRPLLKTESQEKIDKVIKLFKIMAIWPVIKDSGMLGGDLFGLL